MSTILQPNGVASGDTTQSSTVLWTRSTVLGPINFEYSRDRNFSTIAGTVSATVSDPLLPVKAELSGLTAGTRYYYRVTDASGVKLDGEFKTSTALGKRQGLQFGVSGDWRGELSPYPAIANAVDLALDFFVEHGDTIYADFESPVLPGVAQATTLEQYRLKHSEVYGDRFGLNTWADLRRSTSIFATIDDHEVTNDFAGGAPAATDPRFGTTSGLINDTSLFENGLQAFQDYNPLRDEFYGTTGDARTDGERKLYRYNTHGNDAATIVLDNRSFRDTPLADVTNLTDAAQVGAFLARSFDINPANGQPTTRRTLLGQPQLADLKADLLDAETKGITWKFVMVPEPIQNLGIVAASDRYEGYAAERTELLKFIDDNDIDNVVFVSADIHGTLVNNLTYQLGPGQSQIATNAFEISTGSVAFDAPFGQTVAELGAGLGLIDPATKAFYDALPNTNDADSVVNDKDDFIKQFVNTQLTALGYDPIGLNDNLSVANGEINATLLQGDYLATHTFGWTAFDIDPLTQKLVVTTYGIDSYTTAELLADPTAILNRQPRVVSQFEIDPNLLNELTGNANANTLTGGNGGDRINGLAGNDRITGRSGNDELTGGGDNDTFVIRLDQGLDTITDFGGVGKGLNPSPAAIAKADSLQFRGQGLTARNLLLTQEGQDLAIGFAGAAQTQIVLQNFRLVNLNNLTTATGTAVNLGNILFTGQSQIRDSFDVFNVNSQRNQVFKRNFVTFLNDLNNSVSGFSQSDDVINGQNGNDRILGLGGRDLLRGGAGDDTLVGGNGQDILVGGVGADLLIGGGDGDRFVLATSEGIDTIADFQIGQDLIQLVDSVSFDQVTIAQGTGANANNSIISILGQDVAILTGIQATNLGSSSFVFA